jgi:hypothetical protein
MQQSPSGKVNMSSANYQIPPETPIILFTSPPTPNSSYREPDKSSPYPPIPPL